MNMMGLVDRAPFVRVTDYLWFTRVLLESGYRPYVIRERDILGEPMQHSWLTIWTHSDEDAEGYAGEPVKRQKWERGVLVRPGDIIIVTFDDGGMITVAR